MIYSPEGRKKYYKMYDIIQKKIHKGFVDKRNKYTQCKTMLITSVHVYAPESQIIISPAWLKTDWVFHTTLAHIVYVCVHESQTIISQAGFNSL